MGMSAIDEAAANQPPKPREHGKPVAAGAVMDGPFRPTISLDPGNVKAIVHFQEFEGYLQPAVSAFSVATEGLKEIDNAYQKCKRNPSWNENQIQLNVAGFAEKKYEQITRAFDTAFKNLASAAKTLDESLSTPLEASASGSIAAEIRAYASKLPDDKRGKFLSEALQKNDTKTLTAILGAPAFLSGLSDEMQKHHTRLYHEKQNPAAVRKLTAYRAAIALVQQRSGLIHEQVQKAMRSDWEHIKELREANDAATKALEIRVNGVG